MRRSLSHLVRRALLGAAAGVLAVPVVGSLAGPPAAASAQPGCGPVTQQAAAALFDGELPDRLQRVWTVTVHHGTHPMRLKRRLHDLLSDLEARGLHEIDELGLYDIYDDPERDWPEVSSARSRVATETMQPGFSVMMTAWSGWLGDGDDALSYVEDQLANQRLDVTTKLANSNRDEAHAAVLLVHDVIGPMWAIEEGKIPTRPPRLPAGIDALWIIARGQFPLRGVFVLPGQPWRAVEVTPDDYREVCAANRGSPEARSS